MVKPDLLFLAHRIPYPPDKGDKIRSWHLLHHLTKSWSVHLGCFVDDPVDMQHKEFLEQYTKSLCLIPLSPFYARIKSLLGFVTGEPLSVRYYRSQAMESYVNTVREKHELSAEVAFSSTMAPYCERTHVPVLIDFCDSDAEKWRAYGQVNHGLMGAVYRREAQRLAAFETRYINFAHAAFAITQEEATLFNTRHGVKKSVLYWENGVDTDYYNPRHSHNMDEVFEADCVFVGAMDYQANVDAVLWFCQSVWPHIRHNKPDARLAIVGSKPIAPIRALHGQGGICVTGRVADVRPWLQKARTVVTPLRIARGIQNKVLEAMAMAKPVIATQAAAQGISAVHNVEILIEDEAQAMAQSIVKLLQDPERSHEIGDAAYQFVQQHYQWPEKLKRFDDVLKAFAN